MFTEVNSSGAEALSDFEVMFSNCYLYNKPTDDVTLMCQAVESAFKDLVKRMNSDPTLRSELEVNLEINITLPRSIA